MHRGLRNVLLIAAGLVGCDDGGSEPADSGAGTGTGASDGVAETAMADDGPAMDDGVDDGVDDGADDGADDGPEDGADEDSSGGGPEMIPEPGDGTDLWAGTGYISIPSRAWQVGLATMSDPYVEATADATGLVFYVFEAGLTELTINTTANPEGPIESIHLHDATGLVLGDEIPPDETFPAGATWTLEMGNIYVLEFVYPGAGFF